MNSILWLKVKVLVPQSCPILWDPTDSSQPESSVHGILQARILEWVAISFSRGSSRFRDWTWVFCIAGRFFTIWATRDAPCQGSPPAVPSYSSSGDLSAWLLFTTILWWLLPHRWENVQTSCNEKHAHRGSDHCPPLPVPRIHSLSLYSLILSDCSSSCA